MPATVLSIKAEIRDHSMSIPVPENTKQHGIPNACNQCHKDRDADWAAPCRGIVDHEAYDEILVFAGRYTLFDDGADDFVTGSRGAVPRP